MLRAIGLVEKHKGPSMTRLYNAPPGFEMNPVGTSDTLHALREDAERYRWLRNRLSAAPAKASDGSVRLTLDARIGRAYFDSTFRPRADDGEKAQTLDSAIDSAMAASRILPLRSPAAQHANAPDCLRQPVIY